MRWTDTVPMSVQLPITPAIVSNSLPQQHHSQLELFLPMTGDLLSLQIAKLLYCLLSHAFAEK